tara:strand:- start:18134 stop:18463 length:330 start_codon:yes stop_codon:yes gene_type:complete
MTWSHLMRLLPLVDCAKNMRIRKLGEVTIGCSVITLQPHHKFAYIYLKANPLMLPQDAKIETLLDSDNQDIDNFAYLLDPAIRNDLEVIEIAKPSQHNPISKPFNIVKD